MAVVICKCSIELGWPTIRRREVNRDRIDGFRRLFSRLVAGSKAEKTTKPALNLIISLPVIEANYPTSASLDE
jgi:hypothetical protein